MLRNRTLLALSLAVGCAYTGIGMVVPVRVLYAQSHGASLAIIGAMGSAYLLANFLFQYPVGWSADHWGRKRIMVAGLAVQAVLSLAYLVLADPVWFVALRFVEGVAGATMLPPARAMIADTIAPEQRGRAYGLFSSFFNTGFLLGPALGGLIAAAGYASAFIGSFLFRVVAMALIMMLLPGEGGERAVAREQARRIRWRALFTLPLLGAYILIFGDSIFLGFDLTLLPLWMRYHLGATVTVIGLGYALWAVPNILLAPVGGRLADHGRRATIILGLGSLQIPIYVAYGLIDTALMALILFMLHGIVYALMGPSVDAFVAASSPEGARARVQGMYTGIGMASAFLAALGLSVLYSVDFRLPLFVMAAGFGVCLLAGGALVRLAEIRGLTSSWHGSAHAAE